MGCRLHNVRFPSVTMKQDTVFSSDIMLASERLLGKQEVRRRSRGSTASALS